MFVAENTHENESYGRATAIKDCTLDRALKILESRMSPIFAQLK